MARVPIRRLFGWRYMIDRTIKDIAEGRLSFSTRLPVLVSRLDYPRGGLFIFDGHHRVVEAVLREDRGIEVVFDDYVTETSDVYRKGMVRVSDYVEAWERSEGR